MSANEKEKVLPFEKSQKRTVITSNGKSSLPIENSIDNEDKILFDSLDKDSKGFIYYSDLIETFEAVGIKRTDPRIKIKESDINYSAAENKEGSGEISYKSFKNIIQQSQGNLVQDAIKGNLIIPDFKNFSKEIDRIYSETKNNKSGKVATYIPQLGRVNPEYYGVSVSTTNGQSHSIGDTNMNFCIQSITKPINYCLILEEHGEEKVHKHIGREPSGIGFNGLVLNNKQLPHNPMINAGAIVTCSLIKPELEMADRFDHVMKYWSRLSWKNSVRFNNSVYLSEKLTADRNFALGYFMREKKAFPENTNLMDTLEFYFQCCSIELNAEGMANVAATLANGGLCPITGERVLQPDTVKNCLSLMYSCGMYDFSGEFAFAIGLPAKSGVAGGLMVVVPNLLGICIYSPRLDELGNSVRGIDFCKELVKTFNFHNYDSLTSGNNKIDPRLKKNQSKIEGIISLCSAASEGDALEVRHLVAQGVDINLADYDGRTALHLAASEGHTNIIEYLISKKVNLNPIDRWGNTPLADAYRSKHQTVIDLLEKYSAK
jgi:glutaminase